MNWQSRGGIENSICGWESVKVIDGPFNNFSGVIDDINEDKKKLKVMVKIFGRKISRANMVEKES